MITVPTSSLAATRQLGQRLARSLPAQATVTFSGPLGSGKTTLIRELAAALGATDVSSPTFTYHHRYQGRSGPIDHFDLYRAQHDPTAIGRSGIADYLADPPGLVLIEWPLPALVYPAGVPRLTIHAIGGPHFRFHLHTDDALLTRRIKAAL